MKVTRRVKRSARQLFRICVVDGALDSARVRLVAARLAASRRRGALPILSSFQRLVRLDRDLHTARVESAVPLADNVRERIATGLSDRSSARRSCQSTLVSISSLRELAVKT